MIFKGLIKKKTKVFKELIKNGKLLCVILLIINHTF